MNIRRPLLLKRNMAANPREADKLPYYLFVCSNELLKEVVITPL